ncbi:MAG: hypothetical protein ACK41D_10290 [Rubricoccaceae bacterium]
MQTLLPALLGLVLFASASGCATLEQIAALRQVGFALDRVSQGRLAGVSIDGARGYGDIGALDAARVAASIAQGSLPLDFVLHVEASNPAENPVAARLVALEWTLFVEDTETVSGVFNDARLIAPGTTADLPIAIRLDLVQFFGRNVPELANLALNIAGAGGSPAKLRLQARPSVTTQFGRIAYPGTISITHDVGRR